MRLRQRLRALEQEGRPVRVAVIGAGQMGSGLVRQIAGLPGLRVAGICDLLPERAVQAAAAVGLKAEVAQAPSDIPRLHAAGGVPIVQEPRWLVEAEVDVVADATGDPEAGARLAMASIAARRAVVTMNIEAEATVGPLLAWSARAAGAVYTVAAGDEPSVLCEMVDFARSIGLEVVCAGKGKNNRLDRGATPEAVAEEAAARGMSTRMLAAFVDGTKTMAEMASLANATGLRLDRPGMHGPRANLGDLLHTFVPEADGGILTHRGVVDYAIGDVAPGVFLVVATDSGPRRRDLAYLKAGDGPYYLLHRPYHLASLEAPISIARAALYGEVTMAALGAPIAECVAVAKRDLSAGETIDGIGGGMVYGMAESAGRARTQDALPIGVIGGARVRRDVPKDTLLTAAEAEVDERLTIVQLRRLQDARVHSGTLQPVVTA